MPAYARAWSDLGLPPAWYKDPGYRSRIVREPRVLLAEMGLVLADEVQINVWNSSAEMRYMVLPQQPPDRLGETEPELAKHVSRDVVMGVAR